VRIILGFSATCQAAAYSPCSISDFSLLSRIANGQEFPLMPGGLVPVDNSAAVARVDLHVNRTMNGAAVLDSRVSDPLENRIEFLLLNAETEMEYWKWFGRFVEVQSQGVVDVNRAKGANARVGPWHAEQFRKEPR
jgi:hypothetical protein